MSRPEHSNNVQIGQDETASLSRPAWTAHNLNASTTTNLYDQYRPNWEPINVPCRRNSWLVT